MLRKIVNNKTLQRLPSSSSSSSILIGHYRGFILFDIFRIFEWTEPN